MIQEIEVNKVFQIGRNKKNKTVSVLLKNNNTRKKIENDKINFKKTNISTVKNFLKKQNLIKFGTTAPNNLLREIYESSKLCGEITNENNKAIIHNFKED
jgi:molybdenum cofactor biosynthesis enzyme